MTPISVMTRRSLWLTVAIASFAIIASMLLSLIQERNTSLKQELEIPEVGYRSPFISEFVIPTNNAGANAITADKNGLIWFIENHLSKLANFNPVTKKFEEYTTPSDIGFVWSMTVDRNNTIWFIDSKKDKLWKFEPFGNIFKSYDLPTKGAFVIQMALDQKDNLWLAEYLAQNTTGSKIARFDPKSERFVEYQTPTLQSGPIGITVDVSGNIWFTEISKIGVFFPNNSSFKEYPFQRPIIPPTGIAVDSNGVVWFTEHGGNNIGRFIAVNDTLVEYATATLSKQYPATLPYWIKIDSNGNLWFNEHTGNRIAKFIPSNETLIEYYIPSKDIVDALTFTIDKNGSVWFTELGANKIGVVNASLPVPFVVDALPKQVLVRPGEAAEVKLTFESSSPVSYNSNLYFMATSTMSPLGKFVNASATFSPTSIRTGQLPAQITLHIETETTLMPGIYKVAGGATDGIISYLTTVNLIVKNNELEKRSGNFEIIN